MGWKYGEVLQTSLVKSKSYLVNFSLEWSSMSNWVKLSTTVTLPIWLFWMDITILQRYTIYCMRISFPDTLYHLLIHCCLDLEWDRSMDGFKRFSQILLIVNVANTLQRRQPVVDNKRHRKECWATSTTSGAPRREQQLSQPSLQFVTTSSRPIVQTGYF